MKIPSGCMRVLKLMNNGHTLHSGCFGAWTMEPNGARCHNVHQATARALVRMGLVKRNGVGSWVMSDDWDPAMGL